MEGGSNGGLLYHEVQESKLCAMHCINAVLQGPFFSELDLAALASDLDRKERQMMVEGFVSSGDFLSEESHNVSLVGDFSIQVLQKALEVWDLQVIPLDSPVAEPAQIDPEIENAFICHLEDHWFCIRKVNREWYNFDSLYEAPRHLSKFYLSASLDSLRGSGWTIFLVRGNFPEEFPISSSEASNGFGQWLSPEDAERITKSRNSMQARPPNQRTNISQPQLNQFLSYEDEEMLADMENEDLRAAIAASLMDTFPAVVSAEAIIPQNYNQNSKQVAASRSSNPPKDQGNKQAATITEAASPLNDQSNKQMAATLARATLDEDEDLRAAIAASLMDSSEAILPQNYNQNNSKQVVHTRSINPLKDQDNKQAATTTEAASPLNGQSNKQMAATLNDIKHAEIASASGANPKGENQKTK